MGLISLAIMVVSPGPILFRQERIGYRGRRFSCLKFRTMLVGADTAVHKSHLHSLMNSRAPMKKLDVAGDPRLIPLGALLRSTGLDELPQIINVLRGDMSLVGPRPCVPYEYEAYRPWQKERIRGLPGLTGLWQVSGKNKTTFDEMIHLDISYLRSKSIWLDLGIMLKTAPALLQQVKELLTQFKDPVKQKSVPAEQPYYGQTS
jgi:lipopolysaccharide/colanic/teichoic acid biosynthesis glycosyltransferase